MTAGGATPPVDLSRAPPWEDLMPPELSWPSPTLRSSLLHEVQIEIDSGSNSSWFSSR